MALKDTLVGQALQKVQNFISTKVNDQQGWVRGGQFTPVQQIRDIRSQAPLQTFGPLVLPNFRNQQVQQTYKPVVPYAKKFGEGFGEASTYGLVDIPNAPSQNFGQKLAYGAGFLSGMVNPLNPLNKAMGTLNVGGKIVSAVAPKFAGKIAGKVTGGLLSELAQTGAYTAAQAGSQALGLRPQEEITPATFGKNLLAGTVLRGAFSPQGQDVVAKTVKSLFGGDAFVSDFSRVGETLQRLKTMSGKQEFGGNEMNRIVREAKMYNQKYNLMTPKEFEKLNIQKQYDLIANKLENMVRSGQPPVMGFAQVDRNKLKQVVDSSVDKIDPFNPDPLLLTQTQKDLDNIYTALLNSKKDGDFLNKVKALRARLNESQFKLVGATPSGNYKTDFAVFQTMRGTNIPQSDLLDNIEKKISDLDEIIANRGKIPKVVLPQVKGVEPSLGNNNQIGKELGQADILPTKLSTELPVTNKSLQSNAPLSLPQEERYLRKVGGNAPNFVVDAEGKIIKVKNISNSKYQSLLPEIKVENLNGEIKALQSGDVKLPMALPEGQPRQIIVRNKLQLKKVLAENPNANVRIELKPTEGKIATLGQVPDRADVAMTLPNRIDNFIQDTLGYTTQTPKGGNKQANLYTKTLRAGQEKVGSAIERAMGSDNNLIRMAATTIQNFFRGIGMSPERAAASTELRGGMSIANERAYNVMDSLYQAIGHNKQSLEKINAVLDPTLAKTKVSLSDLSPQEQKVYNLIREGLDIVHDQSYANGHISPELYVKNKGNYVPRLYEVTELPPEVNNFVTQSSKKLSNDLYKQRTDITDWKIENNLNDPVYALGKRLAQVETNTAIKKYTDFLATNPNLVSNVERAGFTKLSDSPTYGALSGKYVLNSAAEDLKGFFFSNQTMQNLYDVFRAYDGMPIRQLQKKILTVFNPTTNVGNIVSDQVFGFLTGVDPITLNKNLLELKSNPKQFKQLSDYLMQQGITGTDITRTDFVNKLGAIDDLATGKVKNKLSQLSDKVQSFYGGTDDVYKVSAFKSLLDKGYTLEEATRKVADGFQNYANVGKFYDVWAKTPIIGKPFVKFQGDLIRIIKNGAVNNPLGLIGFLGTLYGVAQLSSKLSGESPEDYKTRTERFGAPMIPGLNIPLTWQTPIGEINVARYISPFFANNETTNIPSNMLPFVPNVDTSKDVASNIAMNVNDPLLSPLIQFGVNRDFRGKPISDPSENKYQPSTLTSEEKLLNQGIFAGRAYLPPPVNSLIDTTQAAQGKPNMYGSPQTLGQSVARLGGIKLTNMNPEEVQKLREKDTSYQQYKNESLQKQIRSVQKQQLGGEITDQQAQYRINNLQKGIQQVNIQGKGGDINYLNENGSMLTLSAKKLNDIANLPESNRYQQAIKESKQYSMAATILDNTNLTQEQQQTALTRLGVDLDKASYYQIANDNTNLKTMYVLDKVKNSSNPLDQLSLLRLQVNGQMIASNAVLDNLVDEGVLSYAQAKELKKYQFDGKQLTKLSSRSGTRAKKIKIPKLKKIKIKQVKVKAIKTKKFKPVKLKAPKKIKVKKA